MTHQSNMLRIALASSFGSTDTESDKPVRPPSPVISPTYSMGSLSYQEKYSESTSRGLVTKKSDALAKTWKYEDWCEDKNMIVDRPDDIDKTQSKFRKTANM
eukprot:scaffold44488_cov79-Cyclotella_meneghiniana.AAC.3